MSEIIRAISARTHGMQPYVKGDWIECVAQLNQPVDHITLRVRRKPLFMLKNQYMFDIAIGAVADEVILAADLTFAIAERTQVRLPIFIPLPSRISYRFGSSCDVEENAQFELILS